MTNQLSGFSESYLPKINQEMLSFLSQHTSEESLLDSMSYSIDAGGKRLRPLLLLATLAFFEKPVTTGAIQVAAALEMIHTYSLIHDDLPAMDNDDLRRGKPTNHIVYGEALAILAGDGLLTEAFHLISQSQIASEEKLWLIQKIAKSAGSSGMIAGQVADIAGEKNTLSLADLQSVHQRKTGELIEFAVAAGTFLAGQSADIQKEMTVYARNFGIAFQIKDDLLDVLGDEVLLGKKTGADQAHNKSTYTSLLDIAGAQAALADHQLKASQALASVKQLIGSQKQTTLLEELLQTLVVKDERRDK